MGEAKRIARRAAVAVVLVAGCASLPESSLDQAASGVGPGSASAAPGTYAYAVQTRAPHTCQSRAPSFFQRTALEVYVEGKDFEARSEDGDHFVRLDGVGYGWQDDAEYPVIYEIRLDDFNAGYERLMQHSPPRWENVFVFVEPASQDRCAPTSRRPIVLPEQSHRDITDLLVTEQQQYFDKAIAALTKLPFTLLMPDASLAKRFPATRGRASDSAYGLEYLAHAPDPAGESSQLNIGFTAHSADAPAARCANASPARDCGPLFTTSRGYEVFRDYEMMGSSSRDPLVPNYYVKVGDALLHLNYPHWVRNSHGVPEMRAHEVAAHELESIIDSLRRQARPEDLVRFPGMDVDVEE